MNDDKDDGGTHAEPVLDQNDTHTDKHDDRRNEKETILMALDQIGQTIDVMTSVVGRLRHFVEEREHGREAELREAMRPGRVLH